MRRRDGSRTPRTLLLVLLLASLVLSGQDGRIWVRTNQPAEEREPVDRPTVPGADGPPPPTVWVAPTVYDVFEPDGTYLGAVPFPDRTDPMVMRGDSVWAVQRGEFDEAYVVRYRIEHP